MNKVELPDAADFSDFADRKKQEIPIHQAPSLPEDPWKKEIPPVVSLEEFKELTARVEGIRNQQRMSKTPEISQPVLVNISGKEKNMGTAHKIESPEETYGKASGVYRITTELGTFEAIIYNR